MCRIQPILLASLLLAVGTASAEPMITVDKTRQKQDAGFRQSSPNSEKNDAQTQIEQAADHFDAFALQMPKVINAKLDAFMKHGFRAILMDDNESKPAEERMIQSLTGGLHSIGNALQDDMENYRQRSSGDSTRNIESEYHSSTPPTSNQKR